MGKVSSVVVVVNTVLEVVRLGLVVIVVVMLLCFVVFMMWLFVVDGVADGMAVVIGRVEAIMV